MAEKVAKLGVSREKDFMYYVKDGGRVEGTAKAARGAERTP